MNINFNSIKNYSRILLGLILLTCTFQLSGCANDIISEKNKAEINKLREENMLITPFLVYKKNWLNPKIEKDKDLVNNLLLEKNCKTIDHLVTDASSSNKYFLSHTYKIVDDEYLWISESYIDSFSILLKAIQLDCRKDIKSFPNYLRDLYKKKQNKKNESVAVGFYLHELSIGIRKSSSNFTESFWDLFLGGNGEIDHSKINLKNIIDVNNKGFQMLSGAILEMEQKVEENKRKIKKLM